MEYTNHNGGIVSLGTCNNYNMGFHILWGFPQNGISNMDDL